MRYPNINDLYYFPKQLEDKLALIKKYPLTIVEAPSGFGKTTALREYLSTHVRSREHWYICLGEPPEKIWNGICELFAKVDENSAHNLRRLGFLTASTLAELMSIIREIKCPDETFLVIDNYQLVGSDIPREMISAFSLHGNNSLHIIVITQQLIGSKKTDVHNAHIHNIDTADFIFSKKDISEYFRMAGIRLKPDELDSIQGSTEGWIAAIRLQMLNYQQAGSFERTADIDQLIRTAVWNRLTDDERNFLLSVSVLDGFTTRQAQIIAGGESLPGSIVSLLDGNAFIRYFPEKDIYTMHSILQNYLRSRLYNIQTKEFQTIALRRAAESCVAIHDYYPAMRFFLQLGDFDAILSLPSQADYIGYQKERYTIEWVVRLVNECPPETLRKYPEAITTFAFQLFFYGQYETFGYLLGLIGAVLESGELSEDSHRRLAGEMEFIKSFTAYNNIEQMSAHHKAAYALLGGPSSYMFVDAPWTFGSVSVLFMFWSDVGGITREAESISECLPYYIKLARGHGTGGDIVFRAEALFARGADADAEALCHKAIYMARSKRQISLCLCAELILARAAILRGDAEAYKLAVENIGQYAEGEPDWQTVRMIDLCLGMLTLSIGESDIAEWLTDMEVAEKNIFAVAVPYCHILYGWQLLNTRQYSKLYGISGLLIGEVEKTNHLLPQVYHLIHLACAKFEQGRTKAALEHIDRALSLAMPDKIYMPFAEHGSVILPLLESASVSVQDREGITRVIELAKRYKSGVLAVRKAIIGGDSPLTPREREIALLAKDRLTAKEIAKTLFISESTVKGALKIIYSKLNVHSKSELAGKNY